MPEGSPLAVYSKRLTAKVGAVLQARFADRVCVELAMTYGNPSIARALESLSGRSVRKLLVLPLYPQYCSSTTGSVFDRAAGALQRRRWLPETRFVNDYYHHAAYIEALTARILSHWAEVGERSHEPVGSSRRHQGLGGPFLARIYAVVNALVCLWLARMALDAKRA